jgi:PGF-CTERM protein
MKKFYFITLMVAVFLCMGVATVSASNTTSFVDQVSTIDPGNQTDIAVVVDDLPAGMSGFNLTLSLASPDVAEIVGVTFPSLTGNVLTENGTVPGDSVYAKRAYLDGQIVNGSSSVTLATFTVRGDNPGVTALVLTFGTVSDNIGDPIEMTAESGEVRVNGPPAADFTADVTSGTAPLTVTFTDTSSTFPAATAWNWSFGDGNFSDFQNPGHTYVAAGTYTVNLTASNAYGADSEEKPGYITVGVVPVGDPDLQVTAIVPNGDNLFANEANTIVATILNNGTAAAGAFNVTYTVEMEDPLTEAVGGLAAGATTTVTFTDPAIRSSGDSIVIVVDADPGDAVAESDEDNNSLSLPVTVTYNGYKGKTYTGGDNITTFRALDIRGDLLYSFGNSFYLNASANPNWTTYTVDWAAADFPVPETATVQIAWLYVPYEWDTGPVFTDDVRPTVSFNTVNAPFAGLYIDEKYFGTSNPYGMIVYNVVNTFDVNATNTAVLTNAFPGGGHVSLRGMMLVVVYTDETQTRKQIFINEGFDMLYGGADQYTTPEEATAYAPFEYEGVSINTSGYIGSAMLTTFAPGADPDEGDLIFNGQTWTDVWNYGGTTRIGVDERDVAAYLEASGNTAAFRSSEDYMEASNAFLVVEYLDPIPPVADFEADVTSGDIPLLVNFTDLSTGASEWVWNFGDNATSTDANPAHTYTAPGTYTVSLAVTNQFGNDTATRVDYINATVGAPVANFSADRTTGNAPLTVTFTDESGGYEITDWAWDFGDGSTSTAQNPVHIYTDVGVYTVSLTVTNLGGSTTEAKADYINVTAIPPVANFTADVTAGDAPLAVQFTDLSVNADAWAWDFGDGLNATAQNPLHTYTVPGVYTVSLTVTNPFGNATETKTDYITVNETGPTPVPTATLAPEGGGGNAQFDFVTTGTLLTSSEGKVLRKTTYTSEDGIAQLSFARNIVALDDEGNPIDEISIIALNASDIPDVPEGAVFTFAGFAYECMPSGATFTPAAVLTFTFTPEEWEALESEDLTLQFYNEETGVWEEIPVTIDPETRTVTAEVSHFTVFALFAEGAAPVETPTAAPTGTGVPETTEPATTATGTTTLPATEPTQSPGFGAVLGLIGLGAVAVLALRRH